MKAINQKISTFINESLKKVLITAIFASVTTGTALAATNNTNFSKEDLQSRLDQAEKKIEDLFAFVDPAKGDFIAKMYSTLDALAPRVNNAEQIAPQINEFTSLLEAANEFFSIRREFMNKIEIQMKQNPKLVEPIFMKFIDIGSRFDKINTSDDLRNLNTYAKTLLTN